MVQTYPGVAIEERPSGNAPVEGVAASAMAICGYTYKGEEDVYTLSTSPEQFLDQHGPALAGWLVPTTVSAFFGNGGKRVYTCRVVASDAVAANLDIDEPVAAETPLFAPAPDGCEGKVAVADHSGTPVSQFTLTLVTAPLVDTLEVNFDSVATAATDSSVMAGNGAELSFALKPNLASFADNVAVYNAFCGGVAGKWNLHLANTGGLYHGIADIINPVAAGSPTDQANFIVKVNALRAKMQNHGGNVGAAFHLGVDPVAPPGAAPVATYAGAVILLRDLIDWYNLHIAKNGAVVHAVADVANGAVTTGITFPYNSGTDYRLEPGSVEIVWGANTIYDKGDGTFIATAFLGAGTVNYTTGAISLTALAAPPALPAVANITYNLVASRTTKTFWINSNDEFVDAAPPAVGAFPATILDVAGTNQIDRTAKTIEFKTKVSSGVLVPDSHLQANYVDNVTTAEVDYTKLYWRLKCIGKGSYGNGIQCAFAGEPDSFVSVVYDPVQDRWEDTTGDNTNPDLGKYLSYSLVVREATEIGGTTYEDKEEFGDLNLSDPDLANYLPDVVNDTLSGSKLVEIDTPYGTGLPAGLDAVKVTAESLVLAGGGALVGDGVTSAYIGEIVSAHAGNGVVPQTLKLSYVDALGATKIVYDDGYGNLIGWVNAGGTNVVDYDLGTFNVMLRTPLQGAASIAATYYKEPASTELAYTLISGSDGVALIGSAETVSSALDATNRGIYAFKTIEEPLIGPVVPDFAGNATVDNLILAFAEVRKNFFAPLVVPRGVTATGAKHYRKAVLGANTSYGALYAPWVKILDPVLDTSVTFPPLGHIAGAYARCDIERNVGETPAGTEKGKLLQTIGLETYFTKEEVGDLNSSGVNCIVDWPQTGRVIWGGRSLSYTPEWRYLSARRLFEYVEMSLYLSTWWACFENNGSNLRLRLYSQVYNFMKRLYSEGYFNANAKSEREAFYVVCNDSNNPTNVVSAGQVVVDVYIAPSTPAEFIRLRFTQITQGASA